MKRVSVIIPVYNNEKTIARTLDSLISQSFKDFEGIIINDGSGDDSLVIIKEYCMKDPRLSYIDKENGGVSEARNAGLDKATGEFVTFLDADDILPKNSLKWMNQTVITEGCDTVCGIYERTDGVSVYTNQRSKRAAEKCYTLHKDDIDIIHSWSCCNKWFSRSIIEDNSIRFEKLVHLEDAVFLYTYLEKALKISTCTHVMYTYNKPLPIYGRTSTQKVDSRMLTSSKEAFLRLTDITKDYSYDFKTELIYRYIFVILGDYYRRLWNLETEAYDLAREYVAELFNYLPPEKKLRVINANKDLFDSGSLLSKEKMLSEPKILIFADKLEKEMPDRFLPVLFDQSFPCFRICLDKYYKYYVRPEYRDKENLFFVENKEEFFDQHVTDNCFVSVIDTDTIYDHRSLLRSFKEIQNDEYDYVELKTVDQNGSDRTALFKNRFSNKLFRGEYIRRHYNDALFAETHSAFLGKPVMLDFSDEKELMSRLTEEEKRFYLEQSAESDGQKTVKPESEKSSLSFFAKMKRYIKKKSSSDVSDSKVRKEKDRTKDYYYNYPVDRRLIFIEALGKRPVGNSLYMLKELQKDEYNDYRIVFSVKEDTNERTGQIFEREGITNATVVMSGTNAYRKAVFTAGYLFNEVDFPNWWIKKPGQIYTNIWHGTPLKKIGKKKAGDIHHDANASRNFTMADYVLVPGEYAREHILHDCEVDSISNGTELHIGYPRTEEFFDASACDEVRSSLGIKDEKIYAWMPTYSDAMTEVTINNTLEEFDKLLEPDELMYVNLHHKTDALVDYSRFTGIRKFPDEFDTYRFLCAADALVTDYSSIMFDFAVSRKKIILYAPDHDKYTEDRGLYIDLCDLPFALTQNAEDLFKALRIENSFPDDDFLEKFNKYDSKDNAKKLIEYVISGNTDEVETAEIKTDDKKVTFIVSDDFSDGWMNDQLYSLAEKGWPDNTYLSFTEKGADETKDNAYPLIRKVPVYATKGKVFDRRSERKRLYNDIAIERIILASTASASRIAAFSQCDEPAFLFINDKLFGLIKEGDSEALKAVKRFSKYGSGIFINDDERKNEFTKITGISCEVASLLSLFDDRTIQGEARI